MHRCSAGDALIDLCANQPHLSSFIRQWNGAVSGEGISCVPASLSEATAAKQTFPSLVQVQYLRIYFTFHAWSQT